MTHRDRIAVPLAAALLFFAPLAIGATARWAIVVAGLLAIAACVPFVTSSRAAVSVSPLLVLLGAATALTALQLIPLPAALVRFLSEGKLDLVTENARALGAAPPSFTSLSLDPPATLVELAKLAGYVAFAYACLRLAASRRRRVLLMSAIAATGALVALVVVVHEVAGLDRVFGLYTPRFRRHPVLMGPLLNPNHLAGLMALSAATAAGLAAAASGRTRYFWIGAVVLCATTGLLTRSRAGVAALALGLCIAGGLLLLQRRRARAKLDVRPTELAGIVIVGACIAALVATFTAGGVVDEYASTGVAELRSEESKFGAWRQSHALMREYPILGVGRGAFEPAFTGVYDSGHVTFSHLENEYLQAVIDWGFLGAAALALPLLWLGAIVARRAGGSPGEAGVAGGLIALALHNAVDFSFSIAGVAYPAIAAAAVLSHGELRRRRVPAAVKKLRILRLAGLAAAAAVLLLAATPLARSARSETDAIRAAMASDQDLDRLTAAARRSYERHPSDHRSAGLLAAALFQARDLRAVAVVNRALVMHPRQAGLHHLAARMLRAAGRPDQALIEYAAALRHARDTDTLLDEVLHHYRDPGRAARGLPLDADRADFLARRLRAKKRLDVAVPYLSAVVDHAPRHVRTRVLLSRFALLQGDVPVALEAGQEAWRLGGTAEAAVAWGEALGRAGRYAEAGALFDEALRGARSRLGQADKVNLLISKADVQRRAGELGAARETLRLALSLAERRVAAAIHRKLAEIEEKLGNQHQAEWERRRAAELASP